MDYRSTGNVCHFDPNEDQVTVNHYEAVEVQENEATAKKPFLSTRLVARLSAFIALFLVVFGLAVAGLIIASRGMLALGETSKNFEDLEKVELSRMRQYELQMEARINETKLMSRSLFRDRETMYNATHLRLDNEISMIEKNARNMSEVHGKLVRDVKQQLKDTLEQKISQLSAENVKLGKDMKTEIDQSNARIEALKRIIDWYRATNEFLYKVFQDRRTYVEARQSCKDNGARLVTEGIRNSKTRAELVNLMKTSGNDIWIGANDMEKEGTFVWEDGRAMNAGDVEWGDDEPNNSGGVEDCVHYSDFHNWRTNDLRCDHRALYMCEKL